MPKRKKGLGTAARGADWGSNIRDLAHGELSGPLREVRPEKIAPAPWQPRERLDGLEELADNIGRHGVLQPLLVREKANGYELLAGHRRLGAAKRAGLEVVPVRVLEAGEQKARAITLTENLAREDLSAWEEARGLAALRSALTEERGEAPTQRELAELTGRSAAVVNRAAQIADGLPPAVWERSGLDVSERNKLEKGALLRAARAENTTSKAALLYLDARGEPPPWAEEKGKRGGTGGRGRPKKPYRLTDKLESAGRLTFRLRKRPGELEPAEARDVLDRLDPVVEALRERAEDT